VHPCRGSGRFPYIAMTGGLVKIIASANGAPILPEPQESGQNPATSPLVTLLTRGRGLDEGPPDQERRPVQQQRGERRVPASMKGRPLRGRRRGQRVGDDLRTGASIKGRPLRDGDPVAPPAAVRYTLPR
jgi:hypothetical protein